MPVHEEGASITCITSQVDHLELHCSLVTSQGDLVVTGGSDGAVNIARLNKLDVLSILEILTILSILCFQYCQ